MNVKPWYYGLQRILNEHEVPDRHLQHDLVPPVPVRARIEWEKDGEEHTDTVAYAHAPGLILVQISDPRLQTKGAWLKVEDAIKK